MKMRTKALSATVMTVVAVLVAWLGATHTNAQNAPNRLPVVDNAQPAAVPPEVTAIAAALTDAAPAAPESPESPEAVAAAEPQAELPPIQASGDVIMHWPLQNAPIRQALRQLAMWSQRNIVASKNVGGAVTMDLFNVTFREALDSLVRMNELAYVEEGHFIYVYTAEEMEALERKARPLVTEVFHLDYAKPEDVVALIAPLLSSEGKAATTPSALAGIATDKANAGGMNYASNDIIVVSDYRENVEAIAETIRQTDQRPVQVMIEATVMLASLDEDNALGIDFATLDGIDFLGTANSAVQTFFGDVTGGLDFAWTGSDVQVIIQAIENVTDLNVLANPKLLVVNKQRGEIIVGDEIGYLNSTTELQTGSVTQSVDFLETGTRLIVRPFVGADGYVRLEIHPELSDGLVVNSGGFSLPQKQTTECTSNVMVRDGHTIIISGMFREKTNQTRQQVPVLGNVPYLGAAFRKSEDVVEREEVVILITPRIIRQAADEAVSLQLRDDMTRFRVGMRQNLMWFGRSRLAARHLNWAKEHMANGNTAWALWDVNMTLSLSPAHDEAIRFKEYLTGEAIWASEGRVGLTNWVLETMILNEMGHNVNILTEPHRPADLMALPEDVREALGVGPDHVAPIVPEPVVVPAEDVGMTDDADEVVEPVAQPAEPVTDGDDAAAAAEASADEPMAAAAACETGVIVAQVEN
ncbi:MAG: hypothetical protein GX591_03555 [Planctomycetes bacterium]|nr:hypothetical protein [Planctomycetota bacterium]